MDLCSEADEESEHTEGKLIGAKISKTRCDRHQFLWLRAKTVSHEIRDFPRPAKESAFQMQNVTECEIGSILPDENYLK